MAIIVSFLARALGTLRSGLFCYSSISSAGVVLILPGFTIREYPHHLIGIFHAHCGSSYKRVRIDVQEYTLRFGQNGLFYHLHAVPGTYQSMDIETSYIEGVLHRASV